MKKEVALNESDLLGSMREALAHAKGRLTLKTTRVPLPARKMTPAGIARLRLRLTASTLVFATYLNVTPRHRAELGEEPAPTLRPRLAPAPDRRKAAGNSPRVRLRCGSLTLMRSPAPYRAMSEWVIAEWAQRGFDLMVVGGRALVARGLRERTKDIDACLTARQCAGMLAWLREKEMEGAPLRIRRLSAPLHPDWLGRGWTFP